MLKNVGDGSDVPSGGVRGEDTCIQQSKMSGNSKELPWAKEYGSLDPDHQHFNCYLGF